MLLNIIPILVTRLQMLLNEIPVLVTCLQMLLNEIPTFVTRLQMLPNEFSTVIPVFYSLLTKIRALNTGCFKSNIPLYY